MVSEERNAQKVRIDNQLRSDRLELVQPIESLQATHAALRSQNASLQADFASVQEMKNSSKESGRSRIRKLQQSVQALQRRVDETSYVDTIYTEQKPGGVWLWVRDNGCGIPPEDLPRVCERGFTGSDRTRRQATGMGLYLAKELCRKLGLSFSIDSVRGEGTRAGIGFPVGTLVKPK